MFMISGDPVNESTELFLIEMWMTLKQVQSPVAESLP
jgi:hypothetical protein